MPNHHYLLFGTVIIFDNFKEELKSLRCNNNDTSIVYLNYSLPNFKPDNKTIKNIEHLNDSIPDFKLSATMPVVSAIIGRQTTLICSGNYDKNSCTFTSPKGKIHILNSKFDSEEGGRITLADNNAKDCGILIAKVKPDDDGIWRCNATAKYGGRLYHGHDKIILRAFYRENLPASMTSDVLRKLNLSDN